MDQYEERQFALTCLKQLPSEDRMIVMLCIQMGVKQGVMACLLNVVDGTITKRLTKIRENLEQFQDL